MIVELKFDNKIARYGSWLMLDQVDELLLYALEHNTPNLKHPVIDSIEPIFNDIISECNFLKELDRGHSIADANVDISYEMLYHAKHGLMFEGTGRMTMQPRRIIMGENK